MDFSKIGLRDFKVEVKKQLSIKIKGNSYCPNCNNGPMDGSTAVEGCPQDTIIEDTTIRPEVGDPTVCYYCGEVLTYGEGFSIEYPTEKQLQSWKDNPELWFLLNKLKNKLRGKHEKI